MGVSYKANRKQMEFSKYSKTVPPHTQKRKTATRHLEENLFTFLQECQIFQPS